MSIKNLKQFNDWTESIVKDVIPAQTAKLQKVIVLDLFRRLVLKSPVGNPELWKDPGSAPPGYSGGRFRANWQITIGVPAAGALDSTATPVGNVPPIPPNSVVWITNNVPYAERLEMGWSGQAPAGIVSVSIAELGAFG